MFTDSFAGAVSGFLLSAVPVKVSFVLSSFLVLDI